MKKYTDALDNLLDRPIAFNPSFKKITGSTNAALLLSQAFYWSKRTDDPEGWFYKTREDWMDETGLTAEELDGARTKCKSAGVIEEKRKGVPATIHYRVNKPKVYELLGFQIGGNPQSGLSDIPKIGGNPESDNPPDFKRYSENTSGNTSSSDDEAALEKKIALLKTLYEQNVGAVTTLLMGIFRNTALTYPEDWYKPAFEQMVKSAKHRSWSFVEAVLKGWKDNGFGWKPGRTDAAQPGLSATPKVDTAAVAHTKKMIDEKLSGNFVPRPASVARPQIGRKG